MKRALLALLFVLTASAASAAVGIDASESGGSTVGASTDTWSHTTTGSSPMLAFCMLYGADQVVTDFEYDNVNLTFVDKAVANNGEFTVELWKLVSPNTGTHDMEVVLNASNNFVCTSHTFTGANLVTPFGTAETSAYTGAGTSASDTTTGQAGALVVDGFTLKTGGGTITPDGGQTTIEGPTDADELRAIVTTKTGGASVSSGYSWENDFFRWASVKVQVLPASSGPCLGALVGVGC